VSGIQYTYNISIIGYCDKTLVEHVLVELSSSRSSSMWLGVWQFRV